MDATLTPRWIAKRGTQYNTEFRYLEPSYSGQLHYEELANDHLTGTSRSFMSMQHKQNLGDGFGYAMDVSRVSDDNYFRDLSTTVMGTSQTILMRDNALTYNTGPWSAVARVQSFQTLQDPLAPVVPPYRRQPQLHSERARKFG